LSVDRLAPETLAQVVLKRLFDDETIDFIDFMYPFMSDKNAGPHDDEETNQVDPWVQSQLPAFQLRWLERQRDFVDPTEILKFALAEWVVRHPEEWFSDLNVEIAIRLALDEFIGRHREEFISTN
jgi:hypothetical protein